MYGLAAKSRIKAWFWRCGFSVMLVLHVQIRDDVAVSCLTEIASKVRIIWLGSGLKIRIRSSHIQSRLRRPTA
jgi:hypothetical protein